MLFPRKTLYNQLKKVQQPQVQQPQVQFTREYDFPESPINHQEISPQYTPYSPAYVPPSDNSLNENQPIAIDNETNPIISTKTTIMPPHNIYGGKLNIFKPDDDNDNDVNNNINKDINTDNNIADNSNNSSNSNDNIKKIII